MLIQNERKIYDLDLSFSANPNTGDITKLVNFNAIRRSIKMVMKSNLLDKPFDEGFPSIGDQLLFETVSSADIPIIESRLYNAVERSRLNVDIRKLEINLAKDKNGFEITITYSLKNDQLVDTFDTFISLSE